MSEEEVRDSSVEMLQDYLSSITESIVGSVSQCPPVMRVTFKQLHKRVEEQFTEPENEVSGRINARYPRRWVSAQTPFIVGRMWNIWPSADSFSCASLHLPSSHLNCSSWGNSTLIHGPAERCSSWPRYNPLPRRKQCWERFLRVLASRLSANTDSKTAPCCLTASFTCIRMKANVLQSMFKLCVLLCAVKTNHFFELVFRKLTTI